LVALQQAVLSFGLQFFGSFVANGHYLWRFNPKREVDVAIKTAVKKPKGGPLLIQGITAQPKGVRIVSSADLYEFGFVDVIVLIERDSFNELAQAMMNPNRKESIKAFGAAQAGI
jgi:hypothetical protein